jgi:hypothetical protein
MGFKNDGTETLADSAFRIELVFKLKSDTQLFVTRYETTTHCQWIPSTMDLNVDGR